MSEEQDIQEQKRINNMWKWRRRMAIAAMTMLVGTGIALLMAIGMATISPPMLQASGPFFAWWFGSLMGIIMVYIGSATAADISGIISTKAGGGK